MLFFPLCLLICLLSASTASSVASSKDLDFFLAKSSLPGTLILISTSLLLFELALIIFKKTSETNILPKNKLVTKQQKKWQKKISKEPNRT